MGREGVYENFTSRQLQLCNMYFIDELGKLPFKRVLENLHVVSRKCVSGAPKSRHRLNQLDFLYCQSVSELTWLSELDKLTFVTLSFFLMHFHFAALIFHNSCFKLQP